MTSGWQYLRSQSIGSEYIYNTRHDDVAYLHLRADPDHGAASCSASATPFRALS